MISPLYFIGIIVCVAFSAFFSASEMSFSSANRMRLDSAAEDGKRSAALAGKICDRYDDTLSAILIGNNLVNIASSSLATVTAILLTGSEKYTALATAIVLILVIIFGETMPKIVAKKNANRLAMAFAPFIWALAIVLTPVRWVVVGLVKLLIGKDKPAPDSDIDPDEEAVEELQTIIETVEDEGVIDEDRSELLQAALDFSEIAASEAMTARVDVEAIDIDDDWDEILQRIEQTSYSRLPVYEESIDNVIGVLYLNHFFKARIDAERFDLRALLMPPCYVYKTMRLPDVLSHMRRAKQHLAIVTDDYGGTAGVLSMEDVLEQIVGDIWDETDEVVHEITEKGPDTFELDGDLPIGDFLEFIEREKLDEEIESATVGGWMIELYRGFPETGAEIWYEDLHFTVLLADGLRVEKVLLRLPAKKEK